MITVVGMGSKKGDLTLDGVKAITTADVVVVKSQLTHCAKTVAEYRSDAIYCDDLFESAEDFDDLNNLIANRLNSYGDKKVVFCVVGDGSDDTTVQSMQNISVVGGVGLQSSVVGSNLHAGTVAFSAQDVLLASNLLPVPTVVKCIDDKYVASEVQLKLLSIFDDDTPVIVGSGAKTATIALKDLCKQKFNYQTTIYVLPKKLTERQVFEYYDCQNIMAILRSPDGCPWDREQTHKSIIKNVIEEAYELADALEKEDVPHIVEEIGDILMQVLFHLAIGVEDGEYDQNAVFTGLCRKLIDRHPHVFGGVVATNSNQSLDVWNKQKMKEHKIKGTAENLLDVPRYMSALMRCQKICSRASKGGYEFENIDQVTEKVKEELQEFLTADAENKPMEGGDLLFAVVNLLRLSGIDSETALLLSTEKFTRRVVECERLLGIKGLNLHALSMQEFDLLWSEAKKNVG